MPQVLSRSSGKKKTEQLCSTKLIVKTDESWNNLQLFLTLIVPTCRPSWDYSPVPTVPVKSICSASAFTSCIAKPHKTNGRLGASNSVVSLQPSYIPFSFCALSILHSLSKLHLLQNTDVINAVLMTIFYKAMKSSFSPLSCSRYLTSSAVTVELCF